MSILDIFYRKESIMESIEFDSYMPITEGIGDNIKNIFKNIVAAIQKFFINIIEKVKNIFRRNGSSNNTKGASAKEKNDGEDKEKTDEAKRAEEEARKKADEAKRAEEEARKKADEAKRAEEEARKADEKRRDEAIKKAKELKQKAEENKRKAEKLKQEAEELLRKAKRKAEEVRFNKLPKEPLSKPLKANEVQERFEIYNDHVVIFFKYSILSINETLSKFIEMTSNNLNSFYDDVSSFDNKQFKSYMLTKLKVKDLDDYYDSIVFMDYSKKIEKLADFDASIYVDYYNRGDAILKVLKKLSKECTKKLKRAENEYKQYENENNKEEQITNMLENTKFLCWVIKTATVQGVMEFERNYNNACNMLRVCHAI